MDFRILGPLEVDSNGQMLPIGSRQPRALLACLLLSANRVVSRDRLVDALWGEEPPERAANALQVYVSQLRKSLGRELIATQPPGYLIRVGEGALDLERFEHLVAEARGLEPAAAARALRQALSLWRGEPLADLADVPFAEGERRRLQELRLGALEARIEADLELGRHGDLVPELESLVRRHPLREALRGQLMLALYRAGRQSEALDVYRDARRLLQEELGLEPGDALRGLERAILAQDPALGTAPPHHRPSAVPQSTVPMGTVTFLFTDVEGSTKLVSELADDYGPLLEQHHALLREAFEKHGGQEIDSQGDAFFFAFRRAREAVRAAVEAETALADAVWPRGVTVRVRIGIHTGEPGFAESGYHGLDVVRAARISGSAHGGQILVSSSTRDLVGAAVEHVSFKDLGELRLKDIEQPQRVFQVVAPSLTEDFPAPRTVDPAQVMAIGGREKELASAAEAALGAEEHRLRLFRRSRLVALIGALLLAGAAAGIAVALTGGGSAAITVVANSVVAIDPGSGKVKADVAVGKRPVAVAVGGGGVWVANADDQTVTRIDPKTRKVVSTIGIGADVSDITFGFGSVWVADGNDGTVHRIDPKLNAIQGILRFGQQNDLAPNPVFSITTGAGSVWITRGNRLVRIDPATDEVTASYPIPPPVSIAVSGDAAWVATQDERLLRLDPRSGARTGALQLPSGPAATVFGSGALWMIVMLGEGQVWRVDSDSVTTTGTTAVKGFAIGLAVADDAIWVVGERGVLQHVDERTGVVVKTIVVGRPLGAIAVNRSGVWVAVPSVS